MSELPELFTNLVKQIPMKWNNQQFILCGSAVLATNGVRDVKDIDVFVSPELYAEAKRLDEEGYWPTAEFEETNREYKDGRELLRTGLYDFFTSMPQVAESLTFEEVQTYGSWHYILGRGVYVISLRHCLAVKALANREKDLDDMIALTRLIKEDEIP